MYTHRDQCAHILEYAADVKQQRKSAIIHNSGKLLIGCISNYHECPLEKKKNMRIIGISFDSALLLFDCSCSPLSSTQRLYNTFKVRDAVFADRCEHALVFCIVHNIFSTRHFSAVSSQAQTQHEIILSERKFMSVFANEMWGLVLYWKMLIDPWCVVLYVGVSIAATPTF